VLAGVAVGDPEVTLLHNKELHLSQLLLLSDMEGATKLTAPNLLRCLPDMITDGMNKACQLVGVTAVVLISFASTEKVQGLFDLKATVCVLAALLTADPCSDSGEAFTQVQTLLSLLSSLFSLLSLDQLVIWRCWHDISALGLTFPLPTCPHNRPPTAWATS
jgi:hypothetical protein